VNPAPSFVLASLVIFGLIISPSMVSINAENHEIMSPKKQMASGVAAEDVMCKSELVLMIRSTSGTAACVKSTTSLKLSEAGWGDVIEIAMEEVMDEEGNDKEIILEEELSMGEPEQMEENANQTIIELEEGISGGEKAPIEEGSPEDVFSIGGIDLSMAAPVEGNVDAPITIIEFGDYQCPKCKLWFQQEKPTITTKYILTDTVKLYFVDSAWLGDDSVIAAQATHCAEDQEKFSEYHSTLYNNQADIQGGWASSDSLKQFAIELGLDSEMFDECLDSGKYSDRVSYNKEVATSNGVGPTPHFFIIGPDGTTKMFSGSLPSAAFDAAILSLGY
jgi:protein-disulfide isomerase